MVAIQNHHERVVAMTHAELTDRMATLATREDALWPRNWPRMRLDQGLETGSKGGHGPVRYRVNRYVPGREVEFQFDPAIGLHGIHRFQIEPVDGGTRVSHTILADPSGTMRMGWPLAVRWLHDALIEDAFDQLEGRQARFGLWVRFLRAALR